MARLLYTALVAYLVAIVSCMDFVNPPSFGTVGDFSENPIYNEGSRVKVVWDGMTAGKPVTLTLTQLNGTEWMLPMEYLTQSVVDKTSYDWLVATGKDLTKSNMFFFCIFYEGSTTADANSHYFNITAKEVASPSSSSAVSSSSATPSPTTLSISLSSTTTTTTSTPTSSQTAPANLASSNPEPTSSGGMSTGAKVGLGIGIPVALILGLAVGFFLFKHHKKSPKDGLLPPGPPGQEQYAYHGNYPHGGYYQGPVEGAPRTPVEMGQDYREAELAGSEGVYKYGRVGQAGQPHELPATWPK